jgi:hypothetical protein
LVQLIWIFVTGLPSHFLFWYADFGLTWSRNLYAGAAGTALLVTLLLEQSFDQKWVRRGWTSALACLFVLALLHNLGAWRTNSKMSRDFLAELKRLEPAPPPNTTFYVENMPLHSQGVPFFEIGLNRAVRFSYSRIDIDAQRTKQLPAAKGSAIITLRWRDDPRAQLERAR